MSRFINRSSLSNQLSLQGVSCQSYDFEVSKYKPSLFEELNVDFPIALEKSVNKRQAEYLAGRYAAKKILEKFGLFDVDIAIGNQRSPVWPEGIIASITHTESTALCAAAQRECIEYLGIDLENIMSNKLADELKSHVIDSKEESLLTSIGLPFEQMMTLVFSAKESLFKALYYDVQDYFEFDAARLLRLDMEKGHIAFKLTRDLSETFVTGTEISGCFYFENTGNPRILTCVYKHR